MQKLLDNEGRIINSIIKTGYYLEDGNFEDETVYPHTKETEEIYKKALEAKGNKKEIETLEFVAYDSDKKQLFGNWYDEATGEMGIVYFNE